MKASGMLSLLALAATTSAIPLAFPQWSWPGSGSGSGSSSSTADDVKNNVQPCRTYSVIFARGTSEGGNIGSVVGPPLRKALQTKLGANGVAFQGVPYPATWSGNTNGGDNGPQLMTQLAQQAKQQCPNTKVVLVGYSQGGIVVHNAGKSLASVAPAGAVIFGDPYNGQPVTNVPKLKEFCAQGDTICSRGRKERRQFGGTGHLSYGNNAAEAADYIATL